MYKRQLNTFSNCWLSCVQLKDINISIEEVCQKMKQKGIEVRPLWYPMNQQKLLKNIDFYNNNISNNLFNKGLCLPSSSFLQEKELKLIIFLLKKIFL